jgi:hypothetical protein
MLPTELMTSRPTKTIYLRFPHKSVARAQFDHFSWAQHPVHGQTQSAGVSLNSHHYRHLLRTYDQLHYKSAENDDSYGFYQSAALLVSVFCPIITHFTTYHGIFVHTWSLGQVRSHQRNARRHEIYLPDVRSFVSHT